MARVAKAIAAPRPAAPRPRPQKPQVAPPPPDAVDGPHRRDALAWMKSHPEAMRIFESLALQAASLGRKFGMKALAERVRWEFTITRNEADWKVNNNYVSHITRELIRRHPHLSGFIELRRTKEST